MAVSKIVPHHAPVKPRPTIRKNAFDVSGIMSTQRIQSVTENTRQIVDKPSLGVRVIRRESVWNLMKNDTFVSENTFFLRIICFDISILHMFYNLIAEYEIERFSMVRELQAIIDSEYLILDSGCRCNSIEVKKIVITFNVDPPCTAIAKSD